MTVIDRKSIVPRAQAGEQFAFELGCGPNKTDPDSIGIDMLDLETVDIVGEIFEVLAALPSGSASSIYSAHFFEHVADMPRLLLEVARVLNTGARLTIIVPHLSNPFFHFDPTHRVPFGLYTLADYCRQQLFARTIPNYHVDTGLRLQGAVLGFKSYRPRYLRHAFKLLAGLVFNASMYLREFYEENLCWLVPCYEIRFDLVKE